MPCKLLRSARFEFADLKYTLYRIARLSRPSLRREPLGSDHPRSLVQYAG